MSEQTCVCGHPRDSHIVEFIGIDTNYIRKERAKECHWHMNACNCELYRPVLDWPDAEGWWWMEHTTPANKYHPDIKTGGLLYAEHEVGDDTPIVIDDDDHPMETRDEWWARGGITRFTRLLEANPFDK